MESVIVKNFEVRCHTIMTNGFVSNSSEKYSNYVLNAQDDELSFIKNYIKNHRNNFDLNLVSKMSYVFNFTYKDGIKNTYDVSTTDCSNYCFVNNANNSGDTWYEFFDINDNNFIAFEKKSEDKLNIEEKSETTSNNAVLEDASLFNFKEAVQSHAKYSEEEIALFNEIELKLKEMVNNKEYHPIFDFNHCLSGAGFRTSFNINEDVAEKFSHWIREKHNYIIIKL